MERRSADLDKPFVPGQRTEIEEATVKTTIGGARILLVEDNPINMQVARELLERVGILVEEANHGGKALRMLQTSHYDAVLMDLQMPEVDGFTATRLIRSDKRFQSLPIIAMTAHAMEEDKQKCLAAGMNGHIGKPFDLKELYSILTKWIDVQPLPALPPPGHVKNVMKDFPDMPCLDTETALIRLAGDIRLYKKLLYQFYEDHALDAAKITHALQKNELSQAERLAHTSKSVAGQIGAQSLHKVAALLENGIRRQDPKVDTILQDFRVALTEVLDSLSKLALKSLPIVAPPIVASPQSTTKIDPIQVALLMQKMHDLLQEQDSKADTMIEPLRTQLQGHAAETTLNELLDLLKHYDHEGALDCLLRMAKKVGVSLE